MRVGVVDGATTRELRRAVLRPHLAPGDPLPGDELAGELPPPGLVHLAAVDDGGRVVSTCFIYPEPCPWLPEAQPAWHLRQMATVPEVRGRGHGAAVLDAATAEARRHGAVLLWCNARESAGGFYRRAGFVTVGAVFTDAQHTVPHLHMHRALTAQPFAAPTASTG